MPHSSTSSDSDDDHRTPRVKPFGRQRPIHDILGGGKVADVLLWKDKSVSAALLFGIGALWYLFEVVGYNSLTLLCHIVISGMLIIFIWDKGSDIFKWPPPRIPGILSDKSTVREIAAICRVIVSLWIISAVGNYISSLNLLFFGCLCLETLPYLYDKYEHEVDYFITRSIRWLKKSYKKLDREFLNKIPRGPVKEKKHK